VLILYARPGLEGIAELLPAGDGSVGRDHVPANAARLLAARGERVAAQLLASAPFEVRDVIDVFGETVPVLYAVAPVAAYERLRRACEPPLGGLAFRRIAEVACELGADVHFVAADVAVQTAADLAEASRALAPLEIKRLVNQWIGVAGGYLGDFSYSTHDAFYADLGLPIDPSGMEGTTRSRFMQILAENDPRTQGKILEGILAKYPVGSPVPDGSSAARTPEMHSEILGWISRLRGTAPVPAPRLATTSAVVERALRDAEELLARNGATSCVDRVHTALHGYLREVCAAAGLEAPADAGLPLLLKTLRERHPSFTAPSPRFEDITAVLRSLGSIVDKLNPIRNTATVAHPNDDLLPTAEAMLVVNAVRTILHYVEAKLASVG
jgi:hypothetical protein